jgi:hypothetical protein
MSEPVIAETPRPEDKRSRTAARIERLAWLLDDSIRLPGGYRIGIDGFIGMVPIAGDALGMLASVYILLQGRALGATNPLMIRMFGNLLVDQMLGIIPFLGDFFDFTYKANRRNLGLLQDYLDNERETHRSSLLLLILFIILWVALSAAIMYVSYRAVLWLFQLF